MKPEPFDFPPALGKTWGEMVVSGQLQQSRVEMNLVAAALQHGALQVLCAAICYVE